MSMIAEFYNYIRDNKPLATMKPYSDEQAAFFSNLKGSSAWDVLLCILHLPALILLLKLVQCHRRPRLIRDFVFLVTPLLFCLTIFSEGSHLSLILIIISDIYLYRSIKAQEDHMTMSNAFSDHNVEIFSEKSFLSLFKGSIMLVTCITILAVDFRIFPRKFAKTETFGISVMDIGIGGFIVSSALTSKYARGHLGRKSAASISNSSSHKSSLLSSCRALPWKNLSVLALGVGRMVLLKVSNYHERVSEYGLHWNFFVTLFAVWTISDIFHFIVPRRFMVIVSFAILISYQFVLNNTSLTSHMLSGPRNNFFSANREGICSLFSFVPLYLIVESFSNKYFHIDVNAAFQVDTSSNANSAVNALERKDGDMYRNTQNDMESLAVVSDDGHDRSIEKRFNTPQTPTFFWIPVHPFTYRICRALLYVCAFTWISWLVSCRIQPTSRRLTNLTYILIVLAISASLMLSIILADIIGGLSVKVMTLEYTNRGQLFVFLVANICTGIVNLTIKTLYTAREIAIAILLLYSLIIVSVSWTYHIFSEKRK